MASDSDWDAKQLVPMGMFELAGKWTEAIKVIGAGNGAGLVGAGAALTTFSSHPPMLFFIKAGGICFFAGVFTFALAFACIHLSTFAYDEMLHAMRRKETEATKSNSATTTSAMMAANYLAFASSIFFFLGLLSGLVAFLRF